RRLKNRWEKPSCSGPMMARAIGSRCRQTVSHATCSTTSRREACTLTRRACKRSPLAASSASIPTIATTKRPMSSLARGFSRSTGRIMPWKPVRRCLSAITGATSGSIPDPSRSPFSPCSCPAASMPFSPRSGVNGRWASPLPSRSRGRPTSPRSKPAACSDGPISVPPGAGKADAMLDLLSGIRVVSFNHFLLGPMAMQTLADLGADVIAVESIDGAWQRHWAGGDVWHDGHSVLHLCANRNKRNVAIDLKSAEGKQLALRLIDTADVVAENFRPGVMDKLGFGYEMLRRRKPGLIYASASGYGPDGPYVDKPGQDLLAQALFGVMAI